MRVQIVTLFPELFEPFFATSMVKKAVSSGQLVVHLEPLRRHGLGKHLSVDDTPYGGGAGMVLRVDCIASAIEAAEAGLGEGASRSHRVLLTPQGAPFRQATAARLVKHPVVTLICGRYEGFDERVRSLVDEELSLGDFVLAGGEVPAMAVVECCIRLLPGVLGNEESTAEESFAEARGGGLEYPQYTRPQTFRGESVPEILLGGDHGRVARWRQEQSVERTRTRRPDLVTQEGGPPLKGRNP
jgi:tRNA (guanine37-N1)-methyltransferase